MTNTTIVVKTFEYNPDGDANGTLLEIRGRSAGIIGMILSYLKLGTESAILIRHGEVTFQFTGLGGIESIMCPFNSIRCAEAGVSKPLWSLVVGVILALGGLGSFSRGPVGIIGLLVGIALVANYFISKYLYIAFSTGEMGKARGLAFTQGLLNGKQVDLNYVMEAVSRINNHLVTIHSDDNVKLKNG